MLTDVSFDVEAGQIVAVIGSRLGGKTTLLKIAAGIERPDQGSVLLGARRLTDSQGRPRPGRLGQEITWIDRDGWGDRALPQACAQCLSPAERTNDGRGRAPPYLRGGNDGTPRSRRSHPLAWRPWTQTLTSSAPPARWPRPRAHRCA
ncbi:MAG TPA: ATP-binding cassette domain-containing protein [Solirubrobacteraceae bacterium]